MIMLVPTLSLGKDRKEAKRGRLRVDISREACIQTEVTVGDTNAQDLSKRQVGGFDKCLHGIRASVRSA